MMSLRSVLTTFALAIAVGAQANLIQNGSFESVPGPATGAGLLPNNWIAGFGAPNTFSNDGSYGLSPSFGNLFLDTVAQDGIRFVGGASTEPDEVAQLLSAPLVEGERYRLSGWIHRSSSTSMPDDGSFVVSIRSTTDAERVLGTFDATTSYEWQFRSFEFTAPTNSANLPLLVFSPISSSFTGAYMGLDNVNLEVVPEPGTLLALGLGALILVRQRRKH